MWTREGVFGYQECLVLTGQLDSPFRTEKTVRFIFESAPHIACTFRACASSNMRHPSIPVLVSLVRTFSLFIAASFGIINLTKSTLDIHTRLPEYMLIVVR